VKFLLDHDVPDDVAFSLEAMGHVVLKLREVLPATAPDDEVLRLSGERDCLLGCRASERSGLTPPRSWKKQGGEKESESGQCATKGRRANGPGDQAQPKQGLEPGGAQGWLWFF
jgi:hypothetical protein